MNDSLMQGAWPGAAPAPRERPGEAAPFLVQHAGAPGHARGRRAAQACGHVGAPGRTWA